jgi:hypothetical protein
MGDRRKPLAQEHEKTIAAFDRERDEVHEITRRHHEIITNSRRSDRPVRDDHHDHEDR